MSSNYFLVLVSTDTDNCSRCSCFGLTLHSSSGWRLFEHGEQTCSSHTPHPPCPFVFLLCCLFCLYLDGLIDSVQGFCPRVDKYVYDRQRLIQSFVPLGLKKTTLRQTGLYIISLVKGTIWCFLSRKTLYRFFFSRCREPIIMSLYERAS